MSTENGRTTCARCWRTSDWIEPDKADEHLHQAYIDGTATLDDLHNHAIAFAMAHAKDDGTL